MYEHKTQPLASRKVYFGRLLRNFRIGMLILAGSLAIGILGYHYFANQNWIDSLHNASMILSGMGPVFEDPSVVGTGGKIFSSFYALFSGIVFITNIGFIITPAAHRFFHRLHLEEK